MKITASYVGKSKAALHCRPWLGKPYTVYAFFYASDWWLQSGRRPSRKMLDAIDRIPDMEITTKRSTP